MKYVTESRIWLLRYVAPHWGAWIEIALLRGKLQGQQSRTPLGCVD